MLWLCLHLPSLPLDVFARGSADTRPRVVIERRGSRQQVHLCNTRAAHAGVRPGMTLSSAHALIQSLETCERDTKKERAALEHIAAWAMGFTSFVSLSLPQSLLLEVGGSLALFGGLNPLVQGIRQGVVNLGYEAIVAVAPTPAAAELAAHSGAAFVIVNRNDITRYIGPLYIRDSGFDKKVTDAMARAGVRRISDCMRLPRDGLQRRFGIGLLRKLDQITGRLADPRAPFTPPAVFDSELELPAEVNDVEALLFALRRLVLELNGFLQARCSGVQFVQLYLYCGSEQRDVIHLGFQSPLRDTERMMQLFRERLHRLEMSYAVSGIRLEATELILQDDMPVSLFADDPARLEQDWQSLLDRLRARLGVEAIQGLSVAPDHRPEYAWRYCVPGLKLENSESIVVRPLWLLPQPKRLKQRGRQLYLNGIPLVLHSEFERIESGWWDDHDVLRDYCVARDQRGAWFWVFRELTGGRSWFVHGIFE